MTMSDLRRELRESLGIDDGVDPLPPEGNTYRAAFTTRYLLRNAQRHIHFGKVQ